MDDLEKRLRSLGKRQKRVGWVVVFLASLTISLLVASNMRKHFHFAAMPGADWPVMLAFLAAAFVSCFALSSWLDLGKD
jgi:hypothetical protein